MERRGNACRFCNRTFTSTSNRNQHEARYFTLTIIREFWKIMKKLYSIHRARPSGDNKCRLCDKTFANPRSLQQHLGKMHNQRKSRVGTFRCPKCSKYIQNCNIGRHESSACGHKCDQCNYKTLETQDR